MEPERYLKKHHLLTYIQDLTSILIENKYSKGSQKPHPITLIQDYFHRVRIGIHVYQREYKYVYSTPYNRACFIRIIWQCYSKGLNQSNILMCYSEYLQLIQLVCRDFPSHFADEAVLLLSCVMNEPHKVSFCEFMYTFQVLFYYEDFIHDCERLFNVNVPDEYNDLPGKGVVILPRLVDSPTDKEEDSHPVDPTSINNIVSTPLINSTTSAENNVDQLYDQIAALCDSMPYKHFERGCPSTETIQQLFDSFKSSGVTVISFNDFLNALCTSEYVNCNINVLPSRTTFNDTIPPEFGE